MDFDDLLVRAVNLLELFPEVRERYQQAFQHLLVDEYQDTNHAQYRWLTLLATSGATSPSSATTRSRSTASAAPTSATSSTSSRTFPTPHVVKLEQNYRSTQTILSAANAVISNNRDQVAKQLWTEVGEGDPIKVRMLADEHAEARHVLGAIEALLDEGVSRSEVAVFYRTNAQSRVLEDALVRAEVPYQVIGGTKFYERAEIKDAIAYLTLIANPADQISFTRIANSPRRGIGQTSLSRVIAHASTIDESVWDVAAAAERVPGLARAAISALGRFMDDDGGAARDRALGRAGRRAARGGAVALRLRRRARSRADLRGAGADREPRGAGRRRQGVRLEPPRSAASTASSPRSRSSATPTRAATTAAR